MSNARGYRGYIGSRPYFGERAPQHVQNLVIRDYCQRNGLLYLLSATEYAMPRCYMMLESILRELPKIEGMVLHSLFMLPRRRDRRRAVYDEVLRHGRVLHAASENIVIATPDEAGNAEDIWRLRETLPLCPEIGHDRRHGTLQ